MLSVGALVGCGGNDGGSNAAPVTPKSAGTIRVVSNRADLVSGGDALVQVDPADGVTPSALKMDLNGTDVTASFAVRANGKYMGLVAGLKDGANTLTAKLSDGSVAEAKIVNHPNAGPVIYGPQLQPWGCDAGASDTSCNRPVTYSYQYVSSNPALTGFLPYNPASPPTDVGTTTTDAGRTVPFIVRVETGVQDRDYYNIAVLFDPSKEWTPWAPQAGWNQKLLIMHGSGCGNSFAQSNVFAGPRVMDRTGLSRGFAVLSVSLNDSGHNCNIAVQAEADMMAKERVVEAYGEIKYTFGYGGSGGALAQQWVANAYPGIYDGIIVAASFPDGITTMLEVEDCSLLKNYFNTTQVAWSDAAKAAASGHLNTAVCNEWIDIRKYNNNYNPYATNLTNLPGTSPTALGGCDAPTSARYDATFNPSGVRCSLADMAASIFGKDPLGRAYLPYANVGVQYGLSALKAGQITVDQFVSLNASIGSHTIDYDLQPRRVGANPTTIAAAYRSGAANQYNGLAQIPVMDIRGRDITGIHHQYRSWVARARLDRSNGGHGNHVIWYNSGSTAEAYTVMDAWIAAIKADKSSASVPQKVVSNRPAAANDRCNNVDGTGLTMVQCTGDADGSTRLAAGSPWTDDILDCALKPLDRASYGVTFTDAQWALMQSTFPSGVCDFSKPGNGQQATQFWQTYLSSNGVVVGGQPLPPAQ